MVDVKAGCLSDDVKKQLNDRFNRINGQIDGLKKMVNNDRYCVDILQQISSVFAALRGLSRVLVKFYLKICVTKVIKSNRENQKEQIYDELMEVIYKFTK